MAFPSEYRFEVQSSKTGVKHSLDSGHLVP